MHDGQLELGLGNTYETTPAVVPELRDEVAQAWGLPLGERVEVCFGVGSRSAITGILELHSSPPYPWDPRDALRLRIAGLIFSSREIERWTRLGAGLVRSGSIEPRMNANGHEYNPPGDPGKQ